MFDVETKQCTGTLLGHTGTIKKVDWNKSNPSEKIFRFLLYHFRKLTEFFFSFSFSSAFSFSFSLSDILSTASRDGSIRIWDRRIPGTDSGPRRGPQAATEQPIATVNHIKNAHGTKGKPSKGVSEVSLIASVSLN